MKRALAAALAAAALSVGTAARAQVISPPPGFPPVQPSPANKFPALSQGATIPLSEDGSRFVRIMAWSQVWLRYGELNPGSVLRGQPADSAFDFAIRRARLLVQAQASKDVMMVLHLGMNNQSAVSGGFGLGADTPKRPQLYLHDAFGQYQILENVLSVGAGLHYWGGPTRLANSTTISMMTIDVPISNWPLIDKTDQFARQLGVYVKGKIEKFDYRLAVNEPFSTPGDPGERRADYNPETRKKAVTGYFKYDFLEPEANVLPYAVGTYLGKKTVWNVGAGFYHHGDAMAYLEGGERRLADQLFLGVDTFLDLPTKSAGAFTGYLSAQYEDSGPGYVRNVGIINPSSGIAEGAAGSFNGAGNALPTMGTGVTYYGTFGWLAPWTFGRAGQLQPYAALRVSNFTALADPVIVPDLGLNWLILGHNAKITVNYRSRPVFQPAPAGSGGKPAEDTRKSEVTLQTQVYL
ncbi:hypothetical protein [Chondromyces apiculatus]|uniref:Porin n=1 Tax=Chondromyces apiculatus DSM 436 TaxID=1192034 RepID=A0A017T355_9BACT|nr:hypothetical protein [Chondromyces apiculatus]EYF02976.1 Hypothetical protein CAP_6399 [Chondromyces apiculatus DSM 436]